MRALVATRGFTLDEYLALLSQLQRIHGKRPALIVSWVSDGLEDWATAQKRAERIILTMPASRLKARPFRGPGHACSVPDKSARYHPGCPLSTRKANERNRKIAFDGGPT